MVNTCSWHTVDWLSKVRQDPMSLDHNHNLDQDTGISYIPLLENN